MYTDGYAGLASDVAAEYRLNDALHILPLNHIPLETPGLRNASLIKNARLETVVEIFKGQQTGSGQIFIEALPKAFPSYKEQLKTDIPRLQSLAQLTSFDVYSLRIDLRRLGIDVDNQKKLSLSPVKKQELADAMKLFTGPLIKRIYGPNNAQIRDFGDVVRLFKNPDQAEAMKNIRMMADRLKIKVEELPGFIEEYGDVFLSLAYFKRGLDEIIPDVEIYLGNIKTARSNYQLKSDKNTMRIFEYVETTLKDITTSLMGRMESFQEKFKNIWQTIDAHSFQEIKRLITSNHRSLGGVLCGLAVKAKLWEERFPNGAPSITQLKEFSRVEMYAGLEDLRVLEVNARMRLKEAY